MASAISEEVHRLFLGFEDDEDLSRMLRGLTEGQRERPQRLLREASCLESDAMALMCQGAHNSAGRAISEFIGVLCFLIRVTISSTRWRMVLASPYSAMPMAG